MSAAPDSSASRRRAAVDGAVSFGMYAFDELRPAHAAFWAAVQDRAPWLPATLTWPDDVHVSWRSPDLVVGQACGWPLVTDLADLADPVRVVGTFEYDVPEGVGHTYRSVLIARHDAPVASFAGATAAVNGPDSLSGWVSLLAAVHGGGSTWTGEVRFTGAHAHSVAAVQRGLADIASIDAVTWSLLQRLDPASSDGLVVVGHGPQVPCLPIVAGSRLGADAIDELRAAMAAAVADPAIAAHLDALRVRAFVALDLDDYLPLLALAPAG